jgi:hypothetical protein
VKAGDQRGRDEHELEDGPRDQRGDRFAADRERLARGVDVRREHGHQQQRESGGSQRREPWHEQADRARDLGDARDRDEQLGVGQGIWNHRHQIGATAAPVGRRGQQEHRRQRPAQAHDPARQQRKAQLAQAQERQKRDGEYDEWSHARSLGAITAPVLNQLAAAS